MSLLLAHLFLLPILLLAEPPAKVLLIFDSIEDDVEELDESSTCMCVYIYIKTELRREKDIEGERHTQH